MKAKGKMTVKKERPSGTAGAFSDTYFVIMAGGRGERFWPLSTDLVPKPFVSLTGKKTLIEMTVDRAKRIVPIGRIFVVLGREHLPAAKKCLPELPGRNFIVEPVGRDTAPCVGLAATMLHLRDPGAVMVILPSDHYVSDENKFVNLIREAVKMARRGDHLVTIGIIPERPETGYGYIKTRKKALPATSSDCYEVTRFVEKPDLAKARRYVREGGYYWNAGIFVWQARVLLEGLKGHMPVLYEGLEELRGALSRGDGKKAETIFTGFEKVSIDYGLMEKAKNVLMMPAKFRWDDVGTWTSLSRVLDTDDAGNVLRGRTVALDADNCVIISDSVPVAALGVSGLIIVASKDGILVCDASKAQEVRQIAKIINKKS